MRLIAALIATAATAAAIPGLACAQDALFDAAFARADLAFQTTASATLDAGPGSTPFAGLRYAPGEGLVRWTSGEVASFGCPG